MIRPRRRGGDGDDGALVPRTGAAAAAAAAGSSEHPYVYRWGMPTPSPLRRLEDPVADHVLPSRKEQRAAARCVRGRVRGRVCVFASESRREGGTRADALPLAV